MGPKAARGCKACGDKNEDDTYVQCDECDEWWHFSCAGVTKPIESMQDYPWLCKRCVTKTRKEHLSLPKANEEPHPSKLLDPNLKLATAGEGVAGRTTATKSVRSTAGANKGTPSVTREHVGEPNLNQDTAGGDVARQLAVLKRRQEVERRRLELEMQLRFVQEEEALLGLGRDDFSSNSPQVNSFQPGKRAVKSGEEEEPDLTTRQEAARKTISKELPIFSGDPGEWPMFISHYENSTRRCGYSNWENMLRLQKCLKGPALETVRSRLLLPEAVPQVIEKLRKRFGRPVHLFKSLIEKVRRIPVPRMDRLESIIEYGEAVQCMVDHMVAAGERAHITNPLLLEEVVNKLPVDQQMLWSRHIRDMASVDLATFGDYMEELAEDAARLTVVDSPSLGGTSKGRTTKGYVHAHAEPPVDTTTKTAENGCLLCNVRGHALEKCFKFQELPLKERWLRARELSVCFGCLEKHNWRSCKNRHRCGINGCAYRHHVLLHDPNEPSRSASVVRRDQLKRQGSESSQAVHNLHQMSPAAALFRIVPVTVYGASAAVNTFAFLDEGSSMTLVDEDLAVQLGVKGEREPLCIKWTGDTTRVEPSSMKIDLEIGPVTASKKFSMKAVRTVTRLSLPQQSFKMGDGTWDHLKQLPIQEYQDARPRILIGLDNIRLAVPLKTREGSPGDPVAVKCRLGWSVYGKATGAQSGKVLHICECSGGDANPCIQEALRKFYELEQLGAVTKEAQDPDVRRAQTILESTTKRIGNRFESGLLWKSDVFELPPSLAMARRRLECLERRMERDSNLKAVVHRQVKDLLEKGYVHKATAADLSSADPKRIWYLPLGVVTNPKKPGKVRIIWDAAAKVQGTSLNDMLLKGPDELASLLGVLFRFRAYGIAVCADVKEMFLQIRMRKEDAHAQRFLWRENVTDDMEVYLVDVVTFGSACSPATAQYVKNRNAREHAERYPRAVSGIVSSTYVDDYLDSFSTIEEASRVSKDVRRIFENGGFELRNWLSNETSVLDQLGLENTSSDAKSLTSATDEGERVLGLRWNPKSDELTFYAKTCTEMAKIFDAQHTPTKREVLKCVMSLFDPLGLLAHYTIHGRILIQDLWRAGIAWDETIDQRQSRDWRRWVDLFPIVARIRIPRCYFSGALEAMYDQAEIHLFVDASQVAYGCVVYLRVSDAAGEPHCTLVCGKSKVAPLKPLTIPKMELQACLLGVRMLRTMEKQHPFRANRKILWTDSTVALSWIQADPRNYRPFVANRVAEIQEMSDLTEWRWVPTHENPADEATKWKGQANLGWDSMWFQGPTFLLQDETSWPMKKPVSTTPEEEIRRVHFHLEKVNRDLLPLDVERFSRLERMLRTLAWIIRYADNLKRSVDGKPKYGGVLTQEEMERAERVMWRRAQGEFFHEEVQELKDRGEEARCHTVSKDSPIYGLLPYADDFGILRMRGRIGAAPELPYSARFPVILPRDSRITHLLVDMYHRRFRHANNETVVNELRQQYQIPKMRRLVAKVARCCVFYMIRRSLPQVPPMAPLPAQRLTSHVRAFTYVGLDYFGPLFVRRGRAREKRWVALFTCLTIRAIHLEVVSSLSTDSCIMAVRRFVARRGAPVEFFSDNGTNFQGASQQLRREIDERNETLATTFTNANTRWTFNPPGAPHMGGVWERMVRSVKAAIGTVAKLQRTPDDETLLTVMAEAEGMINSRPLTYLPLDSESQEALTPNHFLMGSSSGVKQRPVASTSLQAGLQNSWKMTQHILDGMWRRWIKEYLPVLARQSKWFEPVRELVVGDLVLIVDAGVRNRRNGGTRDTWSRWTRATSLGTH